VDGKRTGKGLRPSHMMAKRPPYGRNGEPVTQLNQIKRSLTILHLHDASLGRDDEWDGKGARQAKNMGGGAVAQKPPLPKRFRINSRRARRWLLPAGVQSWEESIRCLGLEDVRKGRKSKGQRQSRAPQQGVKIPEEKKNLLERT